MPENPAERYGNMRDLESKIAAIGFGTELEYANISRECAARAIQSVIGGEINQEGGVYDKWVVIAPDGRKWAAVFDCSIGETRAESAESCAEIVTPVLHLADMDDLQNVVRALRAAGARATERGSQHIHIGARGYLNARQIANLAKIFYRQEFLILRAAGTYESRLSKWCKVMDIKFIEKLNAANFGENDTVNDKKLNTAWFCRWAEFESSRGPISRGEFRPQHYDNTRYHALNLNNLWRESGTIEFRYFNATTHAGHIKFNILFVLALAAMARECRAAAARPESRREYCAESGKYDLHVFINRLGMIGDFWKNARAYYMSNLGGDIAFKSAGQRPGR